jgi:hypothetical protein
MRIWTLALILSALFGLACAGGSSMPFNDAALDQEIIFYVEHQSAGRRNLNLIITTALQSHGLSVSTGTADERPTNVDYIVTYVDRWAWDMRTYLRGITIEVTRDNSNLIVAMSEAHQDSIRAMGKTYERIVAATTHRLLEGNDDLE